MELDPLYRRLLQFLEESGISQQTLVVFTSKRTIGCCRPTPPWWEGSTWGSWLQGTPDREMARRDPTRHRCHAWLPLWTSCPRLLELPEQKYRKTMKSTAMISGPDHRQTK